MDQLLPLIVGLEDDYHGEVRLDGALPIVSAEWLRAPGKPVILVYGHLDLQPVKGEVWTSPPHEPTVRNGRLYARGAADDMGGSGNGGTSPVIIPDRAQLKRSEVASGC